MKPRHFLSIRFFQLIGCISLTVLNSPLSHANEDPGGSSSTVIPGMKILAGVTVGSNSYNQGYGSKIAWGAQAGLRFAPTMEAGVFYRTAQLSSEDSVDVDVTYMMAEGIYRINSGKGAWIAGLHAGQAEVETSLDLGLLSLSGEKVKKFAFGPKLGYQYPISRSIEFGAIADYTVILTEEQLRSFGFLATVAYSF